MLPNFVSLKVEPRIGEATISQAARLNAAVAIPASVKATFICFMCPPDFVVIDAVIPEG
jgi:hypothetical protein